MTKILNFFIIGLLAGLAVFYQYHHNQQIAKELQDLRAATEFHAVPGTAESATSSDKPQTLPMPETTFPDRQTEIHQSRQNAITHAIAQCSDAVVGINVVQVKEFRNPLLPHDPLSWMLFDERIWPRTIKRRVQNLGSGFIISSDGYIVTNEHVVRGAAEIVVTTTMAHKYQAQVVGTDTLLDLALLKIDDENLPSIPLGNSDDVIVGEWVIAIGNPYGLFDVNDQPSVSVGVISAVQRDFASEVDGEYHIYSDMIQTDAAINRGNSGGPLLNANGEAVGMNTLIFSESGGSVGIGFAIPSNRITAIIDDLLKGGVDRNYWIGIRAVDLTATMARIYGMDCENGAVVTSVDRGSPAAKAGILMEDVIIEINGRVVESARSAKDILRSTDLRVGDKMTMKIARKKRFLDVTLTLAPLPSRAQTTP
jgi:serine protease Do